VGQDRVPTALRRAVLAVTLLDPGPLADCEPRDDGVLVPRASGAPVLVSWGEIVLASGGATVEVSSEALQRRVARWLRLRLHLADALEVADSPATGHDRVLARVRPRGLPVGHPLHPGASWPRRRVLGGALDLGLALRGVDDDGRPDPEQVGLLPLGVLEAVGIDTADAALRADRYLTDMAELAADRLRRDSTAVLRPLGDADVPTLLAAPRFRSVLVDGLGMRSAAIPTRRRGWLDLGRLDPAFVPAAAALTEPDERGFARPVLVTVDEVALVKEGGDIVRQSLADPAPAEPAHPVTRGA
jgi:hypothetical protein